MKVQNLAISDVNEQATFGPTLLGPIKWFWAWKSFKIAIRILYAVGLNFLDIMKNNLRLSYLPRSTINSLEMLITNVPRIANWVPK